jgi:hypothetical protein
MTVYSIWESQFSPEASASGRAATERIWEDMQGYQGYIGHELLHDLDDAGHPNALEANRLAASPRRRFVAVQ